MAIPCEFPASFCANKVEFQGACLAARITPLGMIPSRKTAMKTNPVSQPPEYVPCHFNRTSDYAQFFGSRLKGTGMYLDIPL